MNLTPKQKAFADYYIECGNATEAAKRAGYKQPHVQGSQNLEKLSISTYIKERTQQIEDDRIAKGDEVLKYLSGVMRGDIKDQFGLDASLQDRTKAAELLGKRYGLFKDKVEVKNQGEDEKKKTIDNIESLVKQMVPVSDDEIDV